MGVQYEKKIVVFFDILGFKNMVKKYTPGEIYDIISDMHIFSKEVYNSKFLAFSDSVVNIFDLTPPLAMHGQNNRDYLSNIFQDLARIQTNLMIVRKEQIRGAVTVGDIFFENDNNILFGDGLIKAYELESNIACYPRIIIDYNCLHDLDVSLSDFTHILSVDSDGLPFIDHFKWATSNYCFYNPDFVTNYREYVIHKINDCAGRGINSITQKYGWIVNHFNQSIDLVAKRYPEFQGQ